MIMPPNIAVIPDMTVIVNPANCAIFGHLIQVAIYCPQTDVRHYRTHLAVYPIRSGV